MSDRELAARTDQIQAVITRAGAEIDPQGPDEWSVFGAAMMDAAVGAIVIAGIPPTGQTSREIDREKRQLTKRVMRACNNYFVDRLSREKRAAEGN